MTAADPVTLVAVATLMLLLTTAACARPAIRAAQMDPARALRDE